MPEPISVLATLGLGWVIQSAAGGVVEGAAGQAFSGIVRATKDRIAGLQGAPESRDIARAVRIAQMKALERVIREYREAGQPEWIHESHTRPDLFFQRSLAFCADAIGRGRNPSVKLNVEVTPSLASTISGLLATPAPAGPADQQARAVVAFAEDAVLDELSEALDGVQLPDGFEEHFRNGSPSNPRFLDLFAVYITEQIKENHGFRAVLNSVQLASIESLAFDARELATRIEERFGATLDRVEAKVDAGFDRVIALLSAEKGIPLEPLLAILKRFGDEDVPLDQIPERLAAKADELLALREQWAKHGRANPDHADVQNRAFALINKGDLAGARGLFSEARQRARVSRLDHSKEEAEFLIREAEIDRLEVRYFDAAGKYREAADLVSFNQHAHFVCLYEAARSLQAEGEEFGDNEALQRSIAVYNEAGGLKLRLEDPLGWAMNQNGLGTALASLGKRESGTERMEESIATFQAALEERTRERVPLDWAMTQNNLGVTQARIGARTGITKWLEDAVESHRAALEERTRERAPLDWAMSQNNLGGVLLQLGQQESGTERLLQAEAAFREALKERTRERAPLDWAMTLTNLGAVLSILGKRENRTERLLEAVEAFRLALKERTKERVPLHWAETQANLGSTLTILGERENSTELLMEALEALQAALTEHTRERIPLDWAMTLTALANALASLGRREGGTERLQEAVAAYREVLKEYTYERVPLKWAMTLANLGGALTHLGERESGTEHLGEAVKAFEAALFVFAQSGADYYMGPAVAGLARASGLLGQRVNQQQNG